MPIKPLLADPSGEFAVAVPEYVFYLLHQTIRRRDLAYDAAIGPDDLSAARARTLAIIRRVEGCTMSTLSRFSTIDRTTLTREVDHLVAEDLVTRTAQASDRRRVHLALTAKGQALYRQGLPVLAAIHASALAGVSDERQREIARGLQIVVRNLAGDPEMAEALIAFGA